MTYGLPEGQTPSVLDIHSLETRMALSTAHNATKAADITKLLL